MMKIIIISVLIGVSLGFGVHYDVYKQKDCPGNLIEQGMYDTVLQCLQRCDALHNCVAVTRHVADKKCVFKSACDLYNLQTPNCLCTLYARPPHVYEVEANNDCPGNSIRTLTDSDVAACIRLCDSIPDCVAFFRNHKGTCWLKNACTAKERSKLGNLYLNDLGQFQYLPDAECVSKNIAQIQASSPGQCIRACVDRKGCVAVVYVRDSEKCMLKGECGKITLNRKDDVYLSPDSGILAAITSGHDCASVNGVCRNSGQCLTNEEECAPKCGPGVGRVCCCKKRITASCSSVGGVCRVVGQCEPDERPCFPKCGTGVGLTCCCKVVSEVQCRDTGGICRNAGQCQEGTFKCGPCGTGFGRVCCCPLKSGIDCKLHGGHCKRAGSCANICPKGKCPGLGNDCCCDDVDTGDCGSVGGHCRVTGKCEAGENKCPPKCGIGIGLVCCCRVRNKKECKAKGGSCRNAGQCKKDEETCGQCGKGIGRVCCCKLVGTTCSSIGGTCVPESSTCEKDCSTKTCKQGRKCCCKVPVVTGGVTPLGETCKSRGNTCTAPAQCEKTCSGTCPRLGSVCCCRN